MPARKRRSAIDLSIPELRQLLLEKQKGIHEKRLAHYQQTGRVYPYPGYAQPDPDAAGTRASPAERRVRPLPRGRDKLLLLVEAAAVLGLLVVLGTGLFRLRSLNREVAAALEQPTVAPTPLFNAVILPGGHTPPDSQGGSQPNVAEIPAHLMPVVQSLASLPLPTSSPEQAIRVQIPAIEVDAPVVQGDGWEQLRKGVGQHVNGALPGRSGNLVLSAHNDVFGEIFRDLDKLQQGDTIIVFTTSRQYTYQVSGTEIVEPTRVEVMASTDDPSVTLISCYPYMVNTQRIVIKATILK